ncbi:hypothetical protein [Pseudomonas sp. N4]|uniref:hypothetical protein n=1 Tax=Pseudomonas sp. N4 TaxID=571124 RepID=UPI0039B733F7
MAVTAAMDMYPVNNKILAGCQAAIASKLAPTIESEYDRESQVGYKAASQASFAATDLTGVRPEEPGRL